MNIVDLITAERVELRHDIRSKKRALEDLSNLLAKASGNQLDNVIFTSLINREKLGSTGLGQGVAIPHGRVRGIDSTIGAFMRLGQGVDYEANDGQPADLIFGLMVPEDCTEEHLEILRMLAEMFTNDEFIAKLRKAESSEELYNLLAGYTPPTADAA